MTRPLHDEDDDDYICISLNDLITFDGPLEQMHPDATCLVVKLPAGVDQQLDWKSEIEIAKQAVASGKRVLFELCLGLFKDLKLPLNDQIQFASLLLACKVFREQVLPEFQDSTAGVILGRLEGTSLYEINWDENERENFTEWHEGRFGITAKPELLALSPEGRLILKLFALEVHADFLKLLADEIPDTCPSHLLIDTGSISHTIEELALHQTELFDPVTPLFANNGFVSCMVTMQRIPRGNNVICKEKRLESSSIAVVVPNLLHIKKIEELTSLRPVLELSEKAALLAMSEDSITQSWHGIDLMIISGHLSNPYTIRSLKGFIAAGGRIAHIEKPVQTISSISLDDAIRVMT